MHNASTQVVAVDRVLVELHDSFAIIADDLAIIARFAPASCQTNDTALPRMIRATDVNKFCFCHLRYHCNRNLAEALYNTNHFTSGDQLEGS
jgi:hypothetical protein